MWYIFLLCITCNNVYGKTLSEWRAIIAPHGFVETVKSWWYTTSNASPKNDLISLTQQYKKITQNKSKDISISVEPGSRIIILAEVEQAPQSLLAIYQSLREQNIIDADMHLVQPHDHLVFLGAFAGSSILPSDPALALVADAVIKNKLQAWVYPSPALCLRWRTQNDAYQACNFLPTALRIQTKKENKHILCSAYYDELLDWSNENTIAVVTTPYKGQPELHSNGIVQTNQVGGIRRWSVISTPSAEHSYIYGVLYDGYGVITIADEINESTIDWYLLHPLTHKIEKKLSYPISYPPQHTILVGATNDLSRANSVDGSNQVDGITMRIAQFEQAHKDTYMRYIVYDDQYTSLKTKAFTETLCTKDNVSFFILPGGTSPLRAAIPVARSHNKLIFFPGSGAEEFRSPDLTMLIYGMASYTDEINTLVPYLIEQKGSAIIACIYQSDAFGPQMLEAARAVCKKYPQVKLVEIPYEAYATDMKKQIQAFIKSEADTVLLFATTFAARAFLGTVDLAAISHVTCSATSGFWDPAFREFLKSKGLSIITSEVFPDPRNSELPLVKKYREAMDARRAPYSSGTLEGFMMMNIFIHFLEQEPQTSWLQPDLGTRIMARLTSLKEYNCDGLLLTFDPTQRTLSRTVWIADGDTPFKTYTPKT